MFAYVFYQERRKLAQYTRQPSLDLPLARRKQNQRYNNTVPVEVKHSITGHNSATKSSTRMGTDHIKEVSNCSFLNPSVHQRSATETIEPINWTQLH